MSEPNPPPGPSVSQTALALARLVLARQSREISYRVAAAQTAAVAQDLSYCGDPGKLDRAALLTEILLPALSAGWLTVSDPEAFWPLIEQLSDAQLAEWAAAVLRRYPWPPGFVVPSFIEFTQSPEYLDEVTLSERQVNAFSASLGLDAWHWFVYPRSVNQLVLAFGKGSGKDLLSACILAYVAYCVMNMRNPWFHFRIAPGEPMDCINVAESRELARDVFFVKLERMLLQPCFAPILDQRPGKGIQADKVTFWKKAAGRSRPVRALRLLSLNSKAESVEGKNTFFWVMDEADAFKTKDNHANAREMYVKLSTSSRFADQQIGIIISYTRSRNGFMLNKLKECGNLGGPLKNAWGDKAATYEVLPFKVFIPRGDGTYTNPAGNIGTVPDTVMQMFYEQYPDDFRSVYECDPPASLDVFLGNEAKIDEAVRAAEDAGLEPVAEVETYYRTDRTPSGAEYRYICQRLKRLALRPGVRYYAGGDAGITQDSFALALFHVVPAGEEGYICPTCWEERGKRRLKHYVAQALPKSESGLLRLPFGSPRDWACDHCQAVPDKEHDSWGRATSSGREVQRPVIEKIAADGRITFKTEERFLEATGKWERVQVTETVHLPLVVQDLLVEWKPDKRERVEVDFESVTQVLLALHATGQLDYVKIDQWQAEEKLQTLRRAGLNADDKQMSNPEQLKMYRNYKDLLYHNMIWLLPDQEAARQQLRELQLVNGLKIDHPADSETGMPGAKDLCDAEAIAIQLACQYQGNRARIVTSHARPGKGPDQVAEQLLQRQGRHQASAKAARGGIVGSQLRDLGVKSGR